MPTPTITTEAIHTARPGSLFNIPAGAVVTDLARALPQRFLKGRSTL